MTSPFVTEEQELLRQQIRRLVEEEIKPNGDEWEKNGIVPRSFIKKMGELGLFGIRVPEGFGGSEMNVFGWVVLADFELYVQNYMLNTSEHKRRLKAFVDSRKKT